MIDESAGSCIRRGSREAPRTTAHVGEFCSRVDETGGEILNGERNVP
jgi:hypothetical protein